MISLRQAVLESSPFDGIFLLLRCRFGGSPFFFGSMGSHRGGKRLTERTKKLMEEERLNRCRLKSL